MIDGGSDRRAALAAAAFRRIARDGFEGLRTRDVAADVGINIATLHYYFPTKEALIRGVIGQAMWRFTATMPDNGSPLDQLRGHLRALARLLKEDNDLWAVMSELALRAPRDPDLAHVFQETHAYWRRRLRELIAACIDDGSLQPLLEPDPLAALMIVAIRGLSMPGIGRFRADAVDQIFSQFQRLLGFSQSESELEE